MAQRESIIKVQKYGDVEVERIYTKALKPVTMEEWEKLTDEEKELCGIYAPFQPGTTIVEGDIVCERDVGVKMRDGVTLYADFYKPLHYTGKLPVIISWSCYGKRPNEYNADNFKIMGVPPKTVSPMAKFESADPGFWCRYGYCVANVDPRGVGYSEGDCELFNTEDGLDGYDFIEWCAQQDWCNGHVALAGNSCVAMTQWRIASTQPPHLSCIAPWEGTSDQYRESVREGGILGLKFPRSAVGGVVGLGYVDDQAEMALKYPSLDCPYWQDKVVNFSKVKCPAYVTACWNHFHLRGSMMGFRKIRSTKKWLRAHRDFEWPDAYDTRYLTEMKTFFDRYLKDIRNGWELTPKVRIEVMDAFDINYQTNRPEREFPLKRTEYQKLYLDAKHMRMWENPVEEVSSCRYDGNTGEAEFDYVFNEETELTGYLKLRLWVEADGHDDMDLFIAVKKISTKGEELPVTIFDLNHPGAWGKMRVSTRKLDEKASTDFQPIQAHNEVQKLKKGEIVPVDIEINPTSRIWHKGQAIRVQVAGRYIRDEWFEPLEWETDNKGDHIIHTGGEYDSYLQIPVIPPKYADGDYIYR